MAISGGDIALRGILGAFMGAGQAVAHTAQEDEKAERKRVEEERLSKLRMGEYKAKAEMDVEMAPKKAEAEAKGKAAAEEIVRPGVIETYRQKEGIETDSAAERERRKKTIEGEFADQDADREGKKAAARAKAEEPYKADDDKRRGDEQIRVIQATAQEARKNNWRVDEEGFYVDGDGDRVRRSQRVEGRTVEVFVKAPPTKVTGRDYTKQENLDSINRRIEQIERLISRGEAGEDAEKRLNTLMDERDELLGRPKRKATSTSTRPPLSSFQK